MPAVLREHVPSMLGVGLLLAACGHDLTPAQPRAAKLAFLVEPTRTEGTVPIKPGPQVIILDQFGDTVRDATNTVTVALGANPSGATLTGTTTVTAAAGVASFSDLHIDRPGSGYTLLATAPGLAGAMSVAFRIGLTITAVSAGRGDHTCAITVAQTTYCWGSNVSGQLGDGTLIASAIPVLVALPAGIRFVTVSPGGQHTCALTPDGAAYCWGIGGLLGNGTETKLTPVPVAAPPGVRFATVRASASHTCGITTSGSAYCWGENGYLGQLGDGTTTSRIAPVLVAVPPDVQFQGPERWLQPHVRSHYGRGLLLGVEQRPDPGVRGDARGRDVGGGGRRDGPHVRSDRGRRSVLLGR